MIIVVTNNSTVVSDSDTTLMTVAVGVQCRTQVAPAWDRHAPMILALPAGHVNAGGVAKLNATIISLFDDSDQAGALGWHTEGPHGETYGRVFAKPVLENGGDALTLPLSVASVLSHETIETMLDVHCNLWGDKDGNTGYAVEACDPVESDSYPVHVSGHNVTVSNFILPSWFDPTPPTGTKFDYLGNLTAPFTMTKGGYVIVENESGVSQQFGDKDAYPAWKQETKTGASRTAKRLGDS